MRCAVRGRASIGSSRAKLSGSFCSAAYRLRLLLGSFKILPSGPRDSQFDKSPGTHATVIFVRPVKLIKRAYKDGQGWPRAKEEW